MKTKAILAFIIISSLTSCSLYMKFKYHSAKPRDEKMDKQVSYLLKHKIDTANMFNLRGNSADIFWTTKHPLRINDTLEARPFQVRTFSSSGEPIFNWSICYGFLNEHISRGKLGTTTDSLTAKTLNFNSLAQLTNNPSQFQALMNDSTDLYVVSYWSMYFGTPILTTLREIETFKDTSSLKVTHIKCNLGKWVD